MTVTIEPLHCGSLTAPRHRFERGAGEAPIALPVPSWLIRHPGGTVLFDTGMHEDLTHDSELFRSLSALFDIRCSTEHLVRARLAERGVDPAEVDVVIASHLHFDHVGGLGQLPNARLVVQAAEWRAGTDEDLAAANAFRREDYELGHEVVAVDGEHDVFGDGRLTCLPTPGHTPGHQSLRVRLHERDVVLCGDCAYFESTLAGGELPPHCHDRDAQATSVTTLRRRREEGALVLPGHDPLTFRTLPALLG